MSRTFDLGDILSVTDGKLVSRRHIGGVYDILGYMAGEDLMTHQLPRAMDECRPWLREQHPDLADVEVPAGLDSEDKVLSWLAEAESQYGGSREVEPVPDGAHAFLNPVEEACDLVGTEKVYVFPTASR